MFCKKIVLAFCFLASAGSMKAQDYFLTLDLADSLFRQRNLDMLAAKYNIDQAEGKIIQSKLYANPVIELDENVYNRLNGKYFDLGKQSEQLVSVDQLIYIAGQHHNRVSMAKNECNTVKDEFTNTLRNLHYDLNQTFIKLYYAQQNIKLFKQELFSLHDVLKGLKAQEEKNNISKIETARIQALVLSVRQAQDQYLSEEKQLEAKLRTLLAMQPDVHIEAVFDDSCLDKLYNTDIQNDLLQECINGRADVRIANDNVNMAVTQMKIQKSDAYPQIHVTGQYDRNAGYFPNYFAVGLSLTIPIFNRNQGNIRSAKARIEQERYLYESTVAKAKDEVQVAYDNLQRCLKLSSDVARDFDLDNMTGLFNGVNDNYKKRNISLIEFVDFYKTYKDAILQVAEIRQSAFLAIEDLNYKAGTEIIKY